jgi:hypothetical protein
MPYFGLPLSMSHNEASRSRFSGRGAVVAGGFEGDAVSARSGKARSRS